MCDCLTRARFVRNQCPREFEASRYRHGCDPPSHGHPLSALGIPSVSRHLNPWPSQIRSAHVIATACVRVLALVFFSLGVLACGGGSDGSSGSTSPGTNTIAGEDTNNNGVRDDVEQYINNTYGGPSEINTKNALLQYAKVLQASIVDASTSTNSTASIAAVHLQETANAFQCLAARRPDDFAVLTSELRAIALDTDARRQAFLRSEQLAEAAVDELNFSDPESWAGRCL